MLTVDALSPLLLVDDDDTFRVVLERSLVRRGCHVYAAGDADSALRVAQKERPASAIVDLRMPGPDGLALIEGLRALNGEIRILLLTGYATIALAVRAVKAGAFGCLGKPADTDQILAALGVQALTQSTRADSTPSLDRVEWEHIHRVLEECEGNVSQAARRLRLHRRTLQRKLFRNPPKN